MTFEEFVSAVESGRLVPICSSCHAKEAIGLRCSRCIWKKKKSEERLARRNSELYPLVQLIKENL